MEELIKKLNKVYEEFSSMKSRQIRYMEENRDLKKLLEFMDQQLHLACEAKLHNDKNRRL